MRILVTGGTGFVGRHVVWRLCGAGQDVVFTGRDARQAAIVVAGANPTRPRFVALSHGDAGAAESLAACADGADAVVHCAALSSPWGRPADFEKANVSSMREVIAACASKRVSRLVHLSTPSIYFDFRDRLKIREDDPLPEPVNRYAETKRRAEVLVGRSPLEAAVILRPRAIVGPWDATLLPRLLRVARRGALPLIRGGNALIDLTCVENVVDAIMLALHAEVGRIGRRATFNISNGQPTRIIDLFRAISVAFAFPMRTTRMAYPVVATIASLLEGIARLAPGWEPPLTRYSAGLLTFSQTLDLTRAREHLDYVPRIALAEGLAKTAAWFGAQGAPAHVDGPA